MNKIYVIFLSIGLTTSTPAFSEEPPTCPNSPYLIVSPPDYDHVRYAPIPKERMFDGGSYIASVDSLDDDNGDNKGEYLVQPNWVATHILGYTSVRPSGYAPAFKRPRNWYRLALFNEERKYFKSNNRVNDSYTGVGKIWNRGHLGQRADANRISPEYGCNTHVFANAVPQKANFNQGIWLGLENYISSLANQRGELWVVSGPIFTKGKPIESIGDTERSEIPVAIPDQLFKVVFMERENGVEVISFIYPNKYDTAPPEYKTGKCQVDQVYDHTPFITSLADVERATGLTFFPLVKKDISQFKELRAVNLPAIDPKLAVGYCL